MELTNRFFFQLNRIPNELKLAFVFENNGSLNDLRMRLEDYQMTVENREVVSMVEHNLMNLEKLLENCDTIWWDNYLILLQYYFYNLWLPTYPMASRWPANRPRTRKKKRMMPMSPMMLLPSTFPSKTSNISQVPLIKLRTQRHSATSRRKKCAQHWREQAEN